MANDVMIAAELDDVQTIRCRCPVDPVIIRLLQEGRLIPIDLYRGL